jgi:hypothetical protein
MSLSLIDLPDSVDFALDGKTIDEAIMYLISLKNIHGNDTVLVNDCVDDITGVTVLNLYKKSAE